MKKKITQEQFIFSYYQKNPKRDIPHKEVVDWIDREWKGKKIYDPDRAIRKLNSKGFLIKRSKGVYCYDPDKVVERVLTPFTAQQKKEIFERDDYKCVRCGHGEKEGQEIHADHICPQELGGESIIENGQTLCAKHNFQKKILSQTETGKKMFMGFYRLAQKNGNKELVDFSRAILEVYEEHNINGHIKWDKES